MAKDWIKTLDKLLDTQGVKMTFSQHCHSGIASYRAPGHVCGCRRCRQSRGEHWDVATEEQARLDSEAAQKAMKKAWGR